MSLPFLTERLALLDCATRTGVARDRGDDRGFAHWAAAAEWARNTLGRCIDMEAEA